MAELLVNVDFQFGDEVYIKTDLEQRLGIVTAVQLRQGSVAYEISRDLVITWVHSFEMSVEKNNDLL